MFHPTAGSRRPSTTRKLPPLAQALLLAGLLSTGSAWANPWTINFDPKGQVAPATAAQSGWLLGMQFYCSSGYIDNTALGANPLQGNVYVNDSTTPTPNMGFIVLPAGVSGPSSVTVDVTPDPAAAPADPNCTTYGPMWFDPADTANAALHQLAPGYTYGLVDFGHQGMATAQDLTLDNAYTRMLALPYYMNGGGGDVPASGLSSTVVMRAKGGSASITVNLDQAMPTATTLSFNVLATSADHLTSQQGLVPLLATDETLGYASSTPVSVTIPAGATSFTLMVPAVTPGSTVSITPPTSLPTELSFDAGNAGNVTAAQKTPVSVVYNVTTSAPYTASKGFVQADPSNAGPYPNIANTPAAFVFHYKVTLPVTPPAPAPAPSPAPAPAPEPTPVPGLGLAGMGMLGALLGTLGMRRRRAAR